MITGNRNEAEDLLNVLLALKKNIFRDLNVCEICSITAVSGDKYVVVPINNSKEKLYCSTITSTNLKVGDLVLVIFTNRDSRLNLSRLKQGQKPQDISSDEYHSKEYGIIVASPNSDPAEVYTKVYINGVFTPTYNADDIASQSALNQEISNRQSADENLQNQITSNDTDISNLQNNLSQEVQNRTNADSNLQTQITNNQNANVQNSLEIANIKKLIPEQATENNKLADKAFVNSSIATNTAYYISNNGQPFTSLAQLQAYSGTLTNNDYAFVVTTDSVGNVVYNRYKYNSDTQQWAFEYALNNSSFTAIQWNAINSGITSDDVDQIAVNKTDITLLKTNKANKTDIPTKLPSPGTLTIQQNGITSGTYDGSTNKTINLGSGGGTALPIGAIIPSALPIIGAAYHLLDGTTISQTGVYASFASYLKTLVQNNPNIVCTQAQFDSDVTRTGQCGRFVIDNTNNTIRLPLIKYFIQGLYDINTIGLAVESGLPNITGYFGNKNLAGDADLADGSLFKTNVNTQMSEWSGTTAITRKYSYFEFDASKNNVIYGKSSIVQPPAVQYPYYIVLAEAVKTDVEVDIDQIVTDLNDKVSKADAAIGLPVGSIISAAVPLQDSSVHLLDGETVSITGIYSQFAQFLKNLIDNGKLTTKTDDEFNADVASTGNCGYFVYNASAGTFRFPKITNFIQGLEDISQLGNAVNESLPNINGFLGFSYLSNESVWNTPTGAFASSYRSTRNKHAGVGSSQTEYAANINFNASQGNSIYSGAHVQPRATRFPYYIVVANSYKTQVQIDIDQVTTQVNDMETRLNTLWEEVVNESIISSAVQGYQRLNCFDFNAYDYKVELILQCQTTGGDYWTDSNINFKFQNATGSDLTLGSAWGRFNYSQNYTPSGGTVEGGFTPSGYGKSSAQSSPHIWGLDSNDGSSPQVIIFEFIPTKERPNTYLVQWSADFFRDSIWCQQDYIYKGSLYSDTSNITDMKSMYFWVTSSSLRFAPGYCHLRIFRRPGGWAKFN